jgi:dienelactone hydrolase
MEISKKYSIGLGLLVLAAGAQAQTNPFAKGPDPTQASIRADGPFALTTQTLAKGNGFGGATIYVPTAAGTYALAVIAPGFTEKQSAIAVVSRRLATHGFVVATIDTNSTFDQPPSRATQMQAALNTINKLTTGPIVGKLRGTNAVGGHSMGGGGTLLASRANPQLVAGSSYCPYSTDKVFTAVVTPQVILGGSTDNVAPVNTHAQKFFDSIPAGTPKVLAVFNGQGHQFVDDNPVFAPASVLNIAAFKRFADNDTRYSQFLVNDPATMSSFQSNGPF